MRRLALLLVVACARPPDAPSPLSLDAVANLQGKPGVYLFDANPRTFYDHGHLPGAQWVQFNDVTSALPADRDATLIFYCANELCTASHDAAVSAAGLGYRHVFEMPEGFIGWKKSGRTVAR